MDPCVSRTLKVDIAMDVDKPHTDRWNQIESLVFDDAPGLSDCNIVVWKVGFWINFNFLGWCEIQGFLSCGIASSLELRISSVLWLIFQSFKWVFRCNFRYINTLL
jgi:hypothetical protein